MMYGLTSSISIAGFWINLHHFLYRQALLSQPQKGPHSLAMTGADSDELQHLSPAERESWNAAVAYYAGSFAKRDLLFDEDLITTKHKLEDAEVSSDLANVPIPAESRCTNQSLTPGHLVCAARWSATARAPRG
jgi:hypothetical protein